jgi:predicted nucleic acid-binding protein
VGQLPLSINHAADSLTENLDMAIEHGLSSYDTAYLSLALRLDLPIATQDKALRSAAIRVGIGIVEPTTIPSTRPSSN